MTLKNNLQQQLTTTYGDFSDQLLAYLPSIIGALLLLLIGWMIATLVKNLTIRLTRLIDQYVVRRFLDTASKQRIIKQSTLDTIGKILYWLVLLFFITAASNLLGWSLVTNWMTQLVNYVPKAAAGLIIVFIGVMFANILRNTLYQSLEGPNRALIAKGAYVTIIVIVIFVGIEQLGINIQFVTTLITVFLAVLLAGLVLGFSFGAKDIAANIVAMPYIRQHYKVGDQIKIGETEGQLIEFTQTTLIIENDTGKVTVPARLFQIGISIQQHSEEAE